jgi:16S rRNA (cytosine1402-N4)-methyltransferase
MNPKLHYPVMLKDIMFILEPRMRNLVQPVILDATFGNGGYTSQFLRSIPEARVLALDRDPSAYQRAIEMSKIPEFK